MRGGSGRTATGAYRLASLQATGLAATRITRFSSFSLSPFSPPFLLLFSPPFFSFFLLFSPPFSSSFFLLLFSSFFLLLFSPFPFSSPLFFSSFLFSFSWRRRLRRASDACGGLIPSDQKIRCWFTNPLLFSLLSFPLLSLLPFSSFFPLLSLLLLPGVARRPQVGA